MGCKIFPLCDAIGANRLFKRDIPPFTRDSRVRSREDRPPLSPNEQWLRHYRVTGVQLLDAWIAPIMQGAFGETEAVTIDHLALDTKPDAQMHVRLGSGDTHYRANLIPGATILRLFGDCSTQIGLRENGGRPGLLAAYEGVTFLLPCTVGDYIEIRGIVLSRGTRSRRVGLVALRTMRAPEKDHGEPYQICEPPELVAHAILVSVRPK